MIGTVVSDLIETTQDNINAVAPGTIDDVRKAGRPLVAFSDEIYEQHVALKRFLSEHLYKHEKKLEMTHTAQAIIRELFELYMSDLAKMPAEFSRQIGECGRDRPCPGRRRLRRRNDRSFRDCGTRTADWENLTQ